jgi:hypothetical protein
MNEHLTPEEFVDLLEAAPFEAGRRQHLESCLSCRRELHELEETLGMVKAEARGVPRLRRQVAWLGAAAAIAAAVLILYRSGGELEAPSEALEIQLLAPLEEDSEYRVLEAFAGELKDDDALALPVADFPDPSELTSSELRRLAEGLAREMSETS